MSTVTSCAALLQSEPEKLDNLLAENKWEVVACFSGSFFGERNANWKLYRFQGLRRILALGYSPDLLSPVYKLLGCGVSGDKIYHITRQEFTAIAVQPFRSEWI